MPRGVDVGGRRRSHRRGGSVQFGLRLRTYMGLGIRVWGLGFYSLVLVVLVAVATVGLKFVEKVVALYVCSSSSSGDPQALELEASSQPPFAVIFCEDKFRAWGAPRDAT